MPIPDLPTSIADRIDYFVDGQTPWDPAYSPNGVTPRHVQAIKDALAKLYYYSPTFRTMLDGWLAASPTNRIRFGEKTQGSRAFPYAGGVVAIDFNAISDTIWSNDGGELVQDNLEIVIAHEMSHVYHIPPTADAAFITDADNQPIRPNWLRNTDSFDAKGSTKY